MPGADTIKQVIVVRHDLKMRLGKAIAQGSHASMMFLWRHAFSNCSEKFTEVQQQWFLSGTRKICVRADSEEHLVQIINQARGAGLRVEPVVDAGCTEFHGVPTLTCCAIGPDYADRIDPITGGLKLL